MFTISFNPSHLCNFKCGFCYLTPAQLSDTTKVNLDILDERLSYITRHREITHMDLYGGEVTVLPDDYIASMLDIIRKYYKGSINVITNLSRPINRMEWLFQDDINISVSWDYTCREGWDTVMKNILLVPKPVHLLMLASECMLQWEDHQIGAAQWIIDSLNNVISVEIKPYSPNQANQDKVSYAQFESFVIKWMKERENGRYTRNNYEFINEKLMLASVTGNRNAYSDDHIYITPSGQLAVLDFDLNDNEFFLELEGFKEYERWTETEKKRVANNDICKECPYMGSCMSEHLRDVKSLDESCNGFRYLLEWYEQRIQVKTGDVSYPV